MDGLLTCAYNKAFNVIDDFIGLGLGPSPLNTC